MICSMQVLAATNSDLQVPVSTVACFFKCQLINEGPIHKVKTSSHRTTCESVMKEISINIMSQEEKVQ